MPYTNLWTIYCSYRNVSPSDCESYSHFNAWQREKKGEFEKVALENNLENNQINFEQWLKENGRNRNESSMFNRETSRFPQNNRK